MIEYGQEREPGSQSMEKDKAATGWDNHIFGNSEEDIYGDDPEPDGDDDNDVFLFESL